MSKRGFVDNSDGGNITSSRRSLRWISLTNATYMLQQENKTNDERLAALLITEKAS